MRRKIICLTPVKNEAWILDMFLATTSIWADHIIVLDQNSSDGSMKIASKYSKTVIIKNESNHYDELTRQRLLIKTARDLYGDNNILIALDADEILANFHENVDWNNMQVFPRGTSIFFPWLNVLPGNKTYFNSAGERNIFAYVDDGREHHGTEMHSPRVPMYDDRGSLYIKSVKVLHYQFSVRDRQLSKHRWYECLEKVKYPTKDNIGLYRMYHHIDLPPAQIYDIPDEWHKIYKDNGLYLNAIADDNEHWWDKELCLLFKEYGTKKFKKQAVWYVNWNAINKKYFPNDTTAVLDDPRNLFDKGVHKWLARSQKYPNTVINRIVTRILSKTGW